MTSSSRHTHRGPPGTWRQWPLPPSSLSVSVTVAWFKAQGRPLGFSRAGPGPHPRPPLPVPPTRSTRGRGRHALPAPAALTRGAVSVHRPDASRRWTPTAWSEGAAAARAQGPAPAPPELHRHSFLDDDAVATRPQGPPPSASARTPHSPLTLPAAPAFLPGGRFPSCAGRRAVPAVCSARPALSSWVRCPSSATRERERGSEFSARRGTGPHPPSPGLQGSAPGFGGRAGTACGRLSAARQPVRQASPPT